MHDRARDRLGATLRPALTSPRGLDVTRPANDAGSGRRVVDAYAPPRPGQPVVVFLLLAGGLVSILAGGATVAVLAPLTRTPASVAETAVKEIRIAPRAAWLRTRRPAEPDAVYAFSLEVAGDLPLVTAFEPKVPRADGSIVGAAAALAEDGARSSRAMVIVRGAARHVTADVASVDPVDGARRSVSVSLPFAAVSVRSDDLETLPASSPSIGGLDASIPDAAARLALEQSTAVALAEPGFEGRQATDGAWASRLQASARADAERSDRAVEGRQTLPWARPVPMLHPPDHGPVVASVLPRSLSQVAPSADETGRMTPVIASGAPAAREDLSMPTLLEAPEAAVHGGSRRVVIPRNPNDGLGGLSVAQVDDAIEYPGAATDGTAVERRRTRAEATVAPVQKSAKKSQRLKAKSGLGFNTAPARKKAKRKKSAPSAEPVVKPIDPRDLL